MVDERLNKRLQNINHRYQELFRSGSMYLLKKKIDNCCK